MLNGETLVKTIPKTRPVETKIVIAALNGATRLQILRILIESQRGLTASEISSRLKLTLPTTLMHIEQLVSAGLVKWFYSKRGKRLIKVYRVAERELNINIDLYTLSLTPSIDELDKLLKKFIDEYRKFKVLPSSPSLEEIEGILNVDRYIALALLDYFRLSEDKIVEKLAKELETRLEERGEISLGEISKELKVHEYWAIQVVRKLEERGNFILERGVLRRILQ